MCIYTKIRQKKNRLYLFSRATATRLVYTVHVDGLHQECALNRITALHNLPRHFLYIGHLPTNVRVRMNVLLQLLLSCLYKCLHFPPIPYMLVGVKSLSQLQRLLSPRSSIYAPGKTVLQRSPIESCHALCVSNRLGRSHHPAKLHR